MSEELRPKLLGSPFAFVDDEPLTGFVSIKSQALLFYLAALDDPHSLLRIVVTLCADFYDRPLQIQRLAALFRQHKELVLPYNKQELAEAIRKSARRVGVGVEENVVTTMVTEVADQPGALPLLQHTLTELFDTRQDNVMTLAAYQSIGGVTGAHTQRAEEIYAGLDEAGHDC